MLRILRNIVLLGMLFMGILALFPAKADAATIGAIITRENEFYEKTHSALVSYFNSKGFNKKHRFIIQRPHPDPIAIKNAARKLAAVDVDAIITYGSSATLAAIEETSGIPIIYSGTYEDAIKLKKYRNITGVCSKLPISSLIRYLNTSLDNKSISVIFSSHEPDTTVQFQDIRRISEKYGFSVSAIDLLKPADITTMLSGSNPGAYLVTSSSLVCSVYPTILKMAQGKGIPTASLLYHDPTTSTFQLTPVAEEHGRKTAEKLIQLLKGSSIRNIPGECTTDIELVFNLREARKLGIRIPMDLVTEATKVIY